MVFATALGTVRLLLVQWQTEVKQGSPHTHAEVEVEKSTFLTYFRPDQEQRTTCQSLGNVDDKMHGFSDCLVSRDSVKEKPFRASPSLNCGHTRITDHQLPMSFKSTFVWQFHILFYPGRVLCLVFSPLNGLQESTPFFLLVLCGGPLFIFGTYN